MSSLLPGVLKLPPGTKRWWRFPNVMRNCMPVIYLRYEIICQLLNRLGSSLRHLSRTGPRLVGLLDQTHPDQRDIVVTDCFLFVIRPTEVQTKTSIGAMGCERLHCVSRCKHVKPHNSFHIYAVEIFVPSARLTRKRDLRACLDIIALYIHSKGNTSHEQDICTQKQVRAAPSNYLSLFFTRGRLLLYKYPACFNRFLTSSHVGVWTLNSLCLYFSQGQKHFLNKKRAFLSSNKQAVIR